MYNEYDDDPLLLDPKYWTLFYEKLPDEYEQKSETLVIHPDDISTDFLSDIYIDKGWDVFRLPFFHPDDFRDAITSHKRIVMLGHGSPSGLFNFMGLTIDGSLGSLLKDKETVAIWCYADQYVHKHKLKGFFSGMFISEVSEANSCGIPDIDEETVELSNHLFSSTLGKYIDSDNVLEKVLEKYKVEGNPIIEFNRARLYSNIGGSIGK